MLGTQQSPYLQFNQVRKTYDQKNLVVKDFSLSVNQGEFVTLLGPSGSGKTTVLMMLAGFEHVTAGSITVGNQPITGIAPHKRNIGIVFQNYALFPHMTVAQNLAYPLKVRGLPRAEIQERVKRYLQLIALAQFGDRHPAQLSGGQRQRVALARALIFEPALVLMDEPLGALDKKLREQMQLEIIRLHKQLGFTVIYVTHDQQEALTMSDRIAVFNDGSVQQFAPPSQLYEHPANAFVAGFIGENNFIHASQPVITQDQVHAQLADGSRILARNGDCHPGQGQCLVSIRPEKLAIQSADKSLDNDITARFVARHYVGDFIRYYFSLSDGTTLSAKMLNDKRAPDLAEGQATTLAWRAGDCFAFHAHTPTPQGD